MRLPAFLALAAMLYVCGIEHAHSEDASPSAASTAPVDAPQTAAGEQKTTLLLTGVTLERISRLPSPTQVSDAELSSVAEPLIGQRISVEDLRNIATGMEGKFRDAGYPYARVILPPQKIDDGVVRFTIVEGWVEGVTVLGTPGVETAQAEMRLKASDKTGPVEVEEVERMVALLQKIPGLQSHVSIARGNQGPGAMKFVADVSRTPPKFLVNIQNFGSHSLGRTGATLFTSIPGAAPLGDEFQFAAYNTFDYKEQSSAQAIYERALTMDGLNGRVAATYAHATPSGPIAALGLAAESVTVDASFSYPLFLFRKTSLDVSAGLAYANFNGELYDGAVPYSDDRTRSLYLGLDGKTKTGGWTIAGSTQLRRGFDILHASVADDFNLARPEAEPDALITLGKLSVTTPSLYDFRIKIRAEGQYATRPLMALDEFSFGNYTVVRGYDPGAAAGDSAVAMTFDVTGLRQSYWDNLVGVELTGFYDFGRYWNNDSTGTRERQISSVGGGFQLTFANSVRADLTYAVPLNAPLGQGESRPVPRILFSLTTDLGTVWDKLNKWGL